MKKKKSITTVEFSLRKSQNLNKICMISKKIIKIQILLKDIYLFLFYKDRTSL